MASSSNQHPNYLRLISSDGEAFEVEARAMFVSETLKNLIEEDFTTDEDNGIPLPNVHSSVLARVTEYCKNQYSHAQHRHGEEKDEEGIGSEEKKTALRKWNDEFMKSMDLDGLLELLMAANYLCIKDLLDLTSRRVAHLIKDMSVEEVREILNIENDFTPEEEAAIRKQHPWVFEK